jgi:hypothetical protein
MLSLDRAMKHFQGIDYLLSTRSGQRRRPTSPCLVPAYRVGEQFRSERPCWPKGAQFSCSLGGHELTLFCSDIDEELEKDFARGESEFAILVEHPVIVLAYRFGQSLPWSDVPYSWHLQHEDWRLIPSLDRSPEARALLWITLVDADDGLIRAQRGVALSPPFTRALHSAIREQAMNSFDPEKCTQVLSTLFLKYPRIADRLSLAKVQTIGNT